MKKTPCTLTDAAELRRRAEQRVREQSRNAVPSADAARRLLHELEVHQIELEMQNEELRQARAEADASLVCYTELYDFAPVGCVTLDRDGTIRQINLTGAALLNTVRDKLAGRRFELHVAGKDRPAFSAFLARVFSSAGKEHCELALEHRHDSPRLVRIEARAEAAWQTCHAVMMDITEQKQVQQNLLTFYTAIEQSPISVVIADADVNIQYVNPHFAEATGYSAAEAIGQNPRTLFHSGLMPEETHTDLWGKISSGQVWHGEIASRRKNGEVYWEEAHITPVTDAAGTITNYVGLKIDITPRRQAEAELRNKHNLLTTVINTSTDFIFVKDLQLRTVLCNETFAQALGRHPADLYGKTDIENGWPAELVKGNPEKGIRGYEQDDRDALRGKKIHNDYDPATVNGELRIFDTIKLPILDADGRIIGILGLSRDITDHRAKEQLTQKLLLQTRTLTRHMFDIQEEERRKIARELHDELGQWLTAIQAEAHAIDSVADSKPTIHASAQAISQSASAMHEVIHRMVHSLRPTLLDTLGLVDSLHELEKHLCLPRLGISCEFILEGDLANLSDDLKISLFRLVQEALNNIASYAQANHVSVQLRRMAGTTADADVILLNIEDDGVGFDPALPTNGTGLLSMRERAIAAGGEFDLYSKPGQGVRINVKLPVKMSWEEDYEGW